MEFKQSGILIFKDIEKQISETFKTREFVIEVVNENDPKWNDFIKFQLSNDKCSLIDNIAIGAPIEVSFNLRGRKWEKDGKVSYFNSLDAWRITAQSQMTGSATPVTFNAANAVAQPIFKPTAGQQDGDLPF
jgi:hypothetical protein